MDDIARAYARLARTVEEAATLAESTRQWAVLLLIDAEHQIGDLRRRQAQRERNSIDRADLLEARAGAGRKERGR